MSILSASRISLVGGEASNVHCSSSSSILTPLRQLTKSNESTKVQVDRPRYETIDKRGKRKERKRERRSRGGEGLHVEWLGRNMDINVVVGVTADGRVIDHYPPPIAWSTAAVADPACGQSQRANSRLSTRAQKKLSF